MTRCWKTASKRNAPACDGALYAEHQQLSDGKRKLSSSFRLPARCCAEHPEARAHAGEHDGNLIGGCLPRRLSIGGSVSPLKAQFFGICCLWMFNRSV